MRVLVLADTHVPDHAKALPPDVVAALAGVDLILHAGDVTSAELLEQLDRHAPVRAALGNNDGPDVEEWGAKEEVEIDVDGVRIAMVHIAGPRRGRDRRLRRRFPRAGVIVFGHSHIPVDEEFDGIRLFNPGSPTWKRRQPVPTFGLLEIGAGEVRTRIVGVAGNPPFSGR